MNQQIKFKFARISWIIFGFIGFFYALTDKNNSKELGVMIFAWVSNGIFWGWLLGYFIDKMIEVSSVKKLTKTDYFKLGGNNIKLNDYKSDVNLIKGDLRGFQAGFTKEQKAVLIYNLMSIAPTSGDKLNNAGNELIESTAQLLGIDLDDEIFNILPARIFCEGLKYYPRILNSLSRNQKEWFLIIVSRTVNISRNLNFEHRHQCLLIILESIGIEEDEFKQIVQKSQTLIKKNSTPMANNLTDQDYFDRGKLKGNSKDLRGAISDFTKAIEINPSFKEAYSFRGASKNDLRDFKGAIEDYSIAIKIDPTDASIFNMRGIAKASLSDYQGVVEDFDKALELEPEVALFYFLRGTAKIQVEDFIAASEDFTIVIQFEPDNMMAYYNRAIAYLASGDYINAFFDLTKAGEMGYSDAFEFIKNELPDFKRVESKYIGALDPAFAGRRKGENGEYIMLRNQDGNLLSISIAKGTPASVNKFEIKKFVVQADSETNGLKLKKGDVSYMAYGIVEEEE